MWIFGLLCLLLVSTVLTAPYISQEPIKGPLSGLPVVRVPALYLSSPLKNDNNLIHESFDKFEVIDEKENEDKDKQEEKYVIEEEKNNGEEKDKEETEIGGNEEPNPGEVILEVVKPPSIFEGIFSWPPSISWPSFTWPTFSWPSFELPTLSWPAFLGGRAVPVPNNYYYHYANYPNNKFESLSDGVYYSP